MSEMRMLLDEIRDLKRRLQALETRQEHPGFAASDVARLSVTNTFAGGQTVNSPAAGTIGLIVNTAATPTANVFELRRNGTKKIAFDLANDGFLTQQISYTSLADNGTISLGYIVAVVKILDGSVGAYGEFLTRGGYATVVELADSSGANFTTTKDNAGTCNCYWDTTGYYIQNKLGYAASLSIIVDLNTA